MKSVGRQAKTDRRDHHAGFAPENTKAAEDDIYSGFNDDEDGYYAQGDGHGVPSDFIHDSGFLDSVCSSRGCHRLPSRGVTGPGLKPTVPCQPQSRASWIGTHQSSSPVGVSCLTSTRGAGFTSRSLPLGDGGCGRSASHGVTTTDRPTGLAPMSKHPYQITAMEALGLQRSSEYKVRCVENAINQLLNESYSANDSGNFMIALDRAKKAEKNFKLYTRMKTELAQTATARDVIHINSLAFSVFFNIANQYASNKMYERALQTLDGIIKNKFSDKTLQVRVNQANIHFTCCQYEKAMKYYKMTLDQIQGEHFTRLKIKIMGNIALTYVKMQMFEEALDLLRQMMSLNKFSARIAFNTLLCSCILQLSSDRLKEAFLDLIKVDLEIDEDGVMLDNDKQGQLILEVIRTDDLTNHEKKLKAEADSLVLLAVKMISQRIEGTFKEGFEWCIKQVNDTLLFNHLTIQLEVEKALLSVRHSEFDDVNETLALFDKGETQVNSSAATNLSFLFSLAPTDEVQPCCRGVSRDTTSASAAERYAKLAVCLDQYNPSALVNMGNIHFSRREYEKARHYYESAYKADCGCVEACYNIGLVNKRIGLYERALEVFNKLLGRLNNNSQVLYQIADLYEIVGNTEKSLESFIVLLGLVTADSGVFRRIGDLYQEIGDISQAYHYFNESYRQDPSNITVIKWLGVYYIRAKCLETAIRFFEVGYLVEPNNIVWLLLQAECHRRSGSYHHALVCCRVAHLRAPDDEVCLRMLLQLATFLELVEANEYRSKLQRLELVARRVDEHLGVAGLKQYDTSDSQMLHLGHQMPLAESRQGQPFDQKLITDASEYLCQSDFLGNSEVACSSLGSSPGRRGLQSPRKSRKPAAEDFGNEFEVDSLLPM